MIIFLSEKCSQNIIIDLSKHHDIIRVVSHTNTYKAISDHPDVQVFSCYGYLFIDQVTYNNLTDEEQRKLEWIKHLHIIRSNLGPQYPDSVVMNGKMIGDIFMHNLNYTNPQILEFLNQNEVSLLHVNQGYTGCSMINLDGQGVITYDKGIVKACKKADIPVLQINPGHIHLEGFETGFIGGCSGVVDGIVYFNGAISQHPDYDKIRAFINAFNYKIFEDKTMDLTDCGSFIVLET